ncbi:hypothetical protein [Paracoccus sp. N5]|nr:hypothetical protein [Paracoccus sp. N5]
MLRGNCAGDESAGDQGPFRAFGAHFPACSNGSIHGKALIGASVMFRL